MVEELLKNSYFEVSKTDILDENRIFRALFKKVFDIIAPNYAVGQIVINILLM